MKFSASMGENLENERRNFNKLKLALVSNVAPLNAMTETNKRIPL
jgi:hypothetical protein